jgi:hypothetical protein
MSKDSSIIDGSEQSMSLNKLKKNLKHALKQSGALENVKAQLRKEFILGTSLAYIFFF